MKKYLIIGCGLLAMGAVSTSYAGNCTDAWVTKAIHEVTGRVPSGSANSGDCNIQNYGQGHWSSYADLVAKVRAAQPHAAAPVPTPVQQTGICGDAWVTRAVKEVTGHAPNGSGSSGECSIQRYGNGSWSSYPDLVAKVRAANGMTLAQPAAPARPALPVIDTNLGGNVIPPSGAGIVAGNTSRLISPNGAGIVAGNTSRLINDGGAFGKPPNPTGLVTDNGSGIVAGNTSRLISPNGTSAISDNGAGIVSHNGGNVVTNTAPGLAHRSVMSVTGGSTSVPEGQIYSDDAVRHGDNVYTTKRYPEAESALQCAGFTNNFAPTRPSHNVVHGKDYVVVPHPAVKHAADVDLRPNVNGVGLCRYIKQSKVHHWYKQHFNL